MVPLRGKFPRLPATILANNSFSTVAWTADPQCSTVGLPDLLWKLLLQLPRSTPGALEPSAV